MNISRRSIQEAEDGGRGRGDVGPRPVLQLPHPGQEEAQDHIHTGGREEGGQYLTEIISTGAAPGAGDSFCQVPLPRYLL